MGKVLRRGVLGVVVFTAIAIVVPFLLPLDHFTPELSRVVSEKLGQPVAIDEVQLHLLPTPRIVATGIRVGRKDEITIGALEIAPDLLSFISGPRAVRLIRASRVELQPAALAIPRGMPKGRGGGTPIVVRQLVMTAVTLHHPSLKLPAFDVDVTLADDFRIEQARFETSDASVRLHVEPKSAGVTALSLTAKNWTLPAGAPITFETLAVEGTLKGRRLELTKIGGSLYGGMMAGSARADWTRQWQIAGSAKLAGVDLVPVQQALGKQAKLSGRLNADAAFSTQAKTAGLLGDALALDGPFEVSGGAYQGVDLSKAGDITGQPAVGDATPFEELKGVLRLRGKQVRLSELCVRSPKVVAGGHVEIAADQQLSGKLDVSVAKTGGFIGVPVSLGGTTEDPSVTPSKGYLIGAVIGTVLLPGLGTTIGSSLGSRIEGTKSDCR